MAQHELNKSAAIRFAVQHTIGKGIPQVNNMSITKADQVVADLFNKSISLASSRAS